jgi:hypothetical protein
MAIVTDQTKEMSLMDESYAAAADLSSSRINTVVVPSAVATGRMQVTTPAGQGVLWAGVLLNEPASGALAEVREMGIAKIKAKAAFNAGIELAIDGTDGTVSAAGSGDYVVGISREAAKGANHLVSVRLTAPYQKN